MTNFHLIYECNIYAKRKYKTHPYKPNITNKRFHIFTTGIQTNYSKQRPIENRTSMLLYSITLDEESCGIWDHIQIVTIIITP